MDSAEVQLFAIVVVSVAIVLVNELIGNLNMILGFQQFVQIYERTHPTGGASVKYVQKGTVAKFRNPSESL